MENEVLPVIETFLKDRGLELSKEKTKITHIDEGFDFLGQSLRKFKGKLLIRPAKKNQLTFLTKVREIAKDNKQATAGNLILSLNPVIRGWANYHSHVVSKKIYGSMDYAIFQTLWQWAKRRHPNKGKRWIKDKYFKSIRNHKWVFSGTIPQKDGKPQTLHIVYATNTPIRRHIKVVGKANPYDPQWINYFLQRQRKSLHHSTSS